MGLQHQTGTAETVSWTKQLQDSQTLHCETALVELYRPHLVSQSKQKYILYMCVSYDVCAYIHIFILSVHIYSKAYIIRVCVCMCVFLQNHTGCFRSSSIGETPFLTPAWRSQHGGSKSSPSHVSLRVAVFQPDGLPRCFQPVPCWILLEILSSLLPAFFDFSVCYTCTRCHPLQSFPESCSPALVLKLDYMQVPVRLSAHSGMSRLTYFAVFPCNLNKGHACCAKLKTIAQPGIQK